ncbi:hypothetical protein WG8_3399 [Paenibacillus sp. Aloe-11]|nr:hypothetical protein WG8_3399 [Paenibacillus sp. Aloe-11]
MGSGRKNLDDSVQHRGYRKPVGSVSELRVRVRRALE